MPSKQKQRTESRPSPRAPKGAATRAPKGASRKAATTAPPTTRRPSRGPSYDFAQIERHWRDAWERSGIYRVNLRQAKRPYYNLMMFPYPSAEGLHVGNMYAYVGSDIHGRWRAMQGEDVFEPMGFDAFGIHSENFAIKHGLHPRPTTARNSAHFREQLRRIGNRFDWSHEVSTTEPEYYRWTQWIIVQFFKAGLMERQRRLVNWCPKDQTVLADEQVIAGHCERCGTLVERRELEQWALKITKYADRLLNNLEALDWSERVKAAQRNWIGRSEGLEFTMRVAGQPEATLRAYTTRPDTIYGVTFVALAPEHPLVERITSVEQRAAVAACRDAVTAHASVAAEAPEEACPPKGAFTGAYAFHPLTGEALPIWIADYVLGEYGTGAVMGVPAHDERDLAFARAMGLPVRRVVESATTQLGEEGIAPAAETAPGVLAASGAFTGMRSEEAADAIIAEFEARGLGQRAVTYHLRDWIISRQRYWGPPIPIIWCPEHGAVPVPEDQLPVLLPDVSDYAPGGVGSSPLARIPEFVNTTCPVCGQPARRETDVSDNFLDSAWYFLRYPSSADETQPWAPETTRKWLPVEMYIGGAEHSVLHLMYARFVTMALCDLGHLEFEEPFTRFRAHGIITKDGEKIAKSKGNIINPDVYVSTYGADAFRVYLMFMGPYESGGDFTDAGMGGVVRFLERIWQLITTRAITAAPPPAEARRALHVTVQRVTEDIAALKYHTAIAALMGYLNGLEARASVAREEADTLLRLLAPFAPYISEELWMRRGHKRSIHASAWPEVDSLALRRASVPLVVQVDGRLRDHIEVPAEATRDEIERLALAAEGVRRVIGANTPRQMIYVAGRLVNVVTRR
ncbi:MAG TPA: leucine--tRNA ligase [Ktedonobacterales bacterium]